FSLSQSPFPAFSIPSFRVAKVITFSHFPKLIFFIFSLALACDFLSFEPLNFNLSTSVAGCKGSNLSDFLKFYLKFFSGFLSGSLLSHFPFISPPPITFLRTIPRYLVCGLQRYILLTPMQTLFNIYLILFSKVLIISRKKFNKV
ncbi:hypothetical protein SAMN05216464_103507, partial [Mucilaginibacter pineti]